MADCGRQTKESAQKLDRVRKARGCFADIFADLAKDEEHRAQNGKLHRVFDGAVDRDIHIEINVKQKCEQKGESRKSEGGVRGTSFLCRSTVGDEKERGEDGENADKDAEDRVSVCGGD